MANVDLDPWQRNSDAYDKQKYSKGFGHSFEREVEVPVVLSMLGDVQNTRALDLGCGDGEFMTVLREEGVRIIGVDGSEAQLVRARTAYPEGNFRQADISGRLPFADSTFEVVTARFVLMFIEDLNHVGQETARVLKPSGKFVFTITHPFYPYLQNMLGLKHRYDGLGIYGERVRGGMRMGETVYPYYFRPIEEYIQPLVNSGLALFNFREVVPSDDDLLNNPNLERVRGKPVYLVMGFRK